jgi:DNA-binding transcriptional ArsR family regulator
MVARGLGAANDSAFAERVAEVLKAVAHPLRIRIVASLVESSKHVNALAAALETKQAVVSQQLRILRMRGLVACERQGGFSVYAISEPQLRTLVRCMESCSIH